MEADAKEPTGVTRGQNAVHVMPLDWSTAERVLAPLVDRIDATRAETQLLIVTPDAENAVAAAHAVVALSAERPITVIAATASPRAARLLRASPAHVVVGAPADVALLLQGSALKAEAVRGLVFAWLDTILDTADAAPLENLLSELPKEGARLVLATELSPAHEALIERYARRARRSVESPDHSTRPVAAEYVTTSLASRGTTLRRLLDALDLPRAELFARSASVRLQSAAIVRSLGYADDAVRLSGENTDATNDPIILLELPATREELRAVVGEGTRKVYVLVQPTQLGSLRSLLAGGTLTPIALVEAAERARGKDAALRASLRELLTSHDVRREVLALEPLLAEFDGIEIAAAALRMLEQQRPARPAPTAHAGPMQRLFVNLGERDGVRAQEIIAAITTEAGIPGSQIGKVEVRDTHSIVEVAAAVGELVVGKLTGAAVRGRKIQARVDQPKDDRAPRAGGPPRGAPPRGGDRPARSFDRGERTGRPARTFDRGDRSARPFEKNDRPAKSGPHGAGPRPGAPRKFDHDGGSARPTRPRTPRTDA